MAAEKVAARAAEKVAAGEVGCEDGGGEGGGVGAGGDGKRPIAALYPTRATRAMESTTSADERRESLARVPICKAAFFAGFPRQKRSGTKDGFEGSDVVDARSATRK